ncbi:hypothetical protein BOTU111921_25140 [Bordetella tumbae]|uniref:hypothetical protein n=1 Tax=Bordetella tumbae TaxID=1649139 RepID=UPI0039F138F8
MQRLVFLTLGLALSASAVMAAPDTTQQKEPAPAATAAAASATALAPVQKTEIRDQTAYERLMHNSGVTLQWLWSDERGHLVATDKNDVVSIAGTQENAEGALDITGDIVSIDKDRFLFRGTILIVDAPDQGRRCERTGDFEFKATGKRRYWRLQQMQTCDHLTDYVDIYY